MDLANEQISFMSYNFEAYYYKSLNDAFVATERKKTKHRAMSSRNMNGKGTEDSRRKVALITGITGQVSKLHTYISLLINPANVTVTLSSDVIYFRDILNRQTYKNL